MFMPWSVLATSSIDFWTHHCAAKCRVIAPLYNLEHWKVTAQFICGIAAWIRFFKLIESFYGPLVLTSIALVCVTFWAYRAYIFLCAAIAWGKAWYEYHYPAQIPLSQQLGFKRSFP